MAIRQRIFARDNWQCVKCSTPTALVPCTICDHIIPIAKGGKDDDGNLQSLCQACSDAKSISEGVRIGRPRPTIGADGWPTR